MLSPVKIGKSRKLLQVVVYPGNVLQASHVDAVRHGLLHGRHKTDVGERDGVSHGIQTSLCVGPARRLEQLLVRGEHATKGHGCALMLLLKAVARDAGSIRDCVAATAGGELLLLLDDVDGNDVDKVADERAGPGRLAGGGGEEGAGVGEALLKVFENVDGLADGGGRAVAVGYDEGRDVGGAARRVVADVLGVVAEIEVQHGERDGFEMGGYPDSLAGQG